MPFCGRAYSDSKIQEVLFVATQSETFSSDEEDFLCLTLSIYIYYMAELASQSVRKMTHTDSLPSRAIRFSYRPASFGGKISE